MCIRDRYDPLQGALQNLVAVISTRTNIARMNEILDHPIQQGSDRLSNQGYDIVFDHVGFAYNTGETVLKDVSFAAKQGEVTALVLSLIHIFSSINKKTIPEELLTAGLANSSHISQPNNSP